MANSKNGRTWASWAGMYNTTKWRDLRNFKKKENPICEMCITMGKVIPTYCIDHITPIDEYNFDELFYDYSNLQSLCEPCHQFKTNRDKGDKNHEYSGLTGQALIDSINED